jgi:hypothetical protein
MPYSTIQPPFALKFREMSKPELKAYFRWFLEILPARIQGLTEAVRESPGFGAWQADESPSSLDPLGDWFAAQAETRPRTTQEQQDILARSPYPIEISDYELTNRTFSIAIDIGMYFSQVLLKQHSSLRWEQPFGSKRFVDYGQPVLVGFGVVPFNSVRMMVTLAYGLVSGEKAGRSLRQIFDTWSKMVSS